MAEHIGADIAVALLSGVVTAAVLTTAGLVYGSSLETGRSYIHPTCTDPKGLKPVAHGDLSASGPSFDDSYSAARAIDGYGGSAWNPKTYDKAEANRRGYSKFVPVFMDKPASRTLSIAVSGEHDIALVCLNNGLGNGDERYENWGKVRSVIVSTDVDPARRTAVFQELAVDDSQALQEAGRALGAAKQIDIELVDAYPGSDVESHDPDRCQKIVDANGFAREGDQQEVYANGCILAATPHAGISEITLFEIDAQDPPPIPWRWVPVN